MVPTVTTFHKLFIKKSLTKVERFSLATKLSKKLLRTLLSQDNSVVTKHESKFRPDDQSSNFDGVRSADNPIIGEHSSDSSSEANF